MTSDVHAYRASEAFAAALRNRLAEFRRFGPEVIAPWSREHPTTQPLWRRTFGLDRECVGFDDPGGPVPPDGLSRAKTRRELIPKRGRDGAPWREAMALLNRLPKVEPVFKQYGVEVLVWPDDSHAIYKPGIDETPGGVFITWSAPHPQPGEHLTEVPLSEYYAAVEKRDQEKVTAS